MSVLEETLAEEYDRFLRIAAAIRAELERLPKGSLRKRNLKGRIYYYLQYRDGGHVRSDYVPRGKVEETERAIARRRELAAALKERERSIRQIERALGKGFLNERAK